MVDSVKTKTLDEIKAFSDKQREDIRKLIEHTEEGVRSHGADMPPVVFLFNTERSEINVVGAEDFTSTASKDVFAKAVQGLALAMEADMSVFISESWMLSNDDAIEYQANPDKYPGGMADHPKRFEIVMFAVETKGGSWMAQAEIKTDANGRSLGPTQFIEAEVKGRFSEFLDRSNTH